jgi:simple sugar transport system permease protein
MSDPLLVTSIATALTTGAAVLIAATGELLVEKTGVYNIGIEGMMLAGGLAGVATGSATGSLTLSLLAAILCGTLVACAFGLVVVGLGADMIMAGFAVVFIATGLTAQLGKGYARGATDVTIPEWHIPLLSDIPYVGPALFEQMSLVYLAFLMPIAAYFFLNRTRAGLNMQTIGESPMAADAAGIQVNRTRMLYIAIGGALAGLAGAYITLGVLQTWLPGITAGQGWIAFAIVIFAGWRPLGLIFGALLFGLLGTLGDVGQALGWQIPSQVFSALPYVGTVLVLIILTWVRRTQGGLLDWPTALGQPFTRESSGGR